MVHVARTGEVRDPYVIVTRKLEGKTEEMDVLEDLDIDGSIIL